MNRQRQRWLEEAVSSDRGENAGHALLVKLFRLLLPGEPGHHPEQGDQLLQQQGQGEEGE